MRIVPVLSSILAGCVLGAMAATAAAESAATADRAASAAAQVDALADRLLAHLRETSTHVRQASGLPIAELDDLSVDQARREGEFHRRQLAQLDAVDLDALSHEQWLLARMLRHTFASGARAEEDYWLNFAVTPYSGGFVLTSVQRILGAQPLNSEADRNNYLQLLDRYALMLDQIAAKTRMQADRGIRVAQPAIAGVKATFAGMKGSAMQSLGVAPERLVESTSEQRTAFIEAATKRITDRVVPAYDRILGIFDDGYLVKAPAAVGLGQLPGGKDNYVRRIAYETGLTLTPQQIHQRGLDDVAALERQMQQIRSDVGFKGDRAAFHRMLREDPRFLAKTPQEVEQRYLGYMARIEPQVPKYFSRLPQAPYAVKRVEPAAEAGMTFGYYQRPSPHDPTGYYRYNGSKLDERSLATAAHLIYHELVPGHHFQIALQIENKNVHPVREFLSYGAFVEGWAEYGAELAGEMGMFDDPYDRYGHLVSQAFLATRLVVDTGMNSLGWSLQRARQYMREHVFESEAQIDTESLRYSTDIFAQALGYRLGYQQFMDLRRKAEAALGDRFDIRRFHEAAIGSGAMPLDVLAEHIDWFIAREKAEGGR